MNDLGNDIVDVFKEIYDTLFNLTTTTAPPNITYPQSMWDPEWRWEVEMQTPPFHNPKHVLINISMIQPPYITKPLYAVVVPTIILVSFITNSLVFFVGGAKSLRTPANQVLVTMSFAELLTGISALPWAIYYLSEDITPDLEMSDMWCKSHQLFALHMPAMFHTMSIWLTCFLAIQRFLFVFYPIAMLSYTNAMNIKIILGIIFWAVISETPKALLKRMTTHKGMSGRTYCIQSHISFVEDVIGYNTYMLWTYVYKVVFIHVLPCITLFTLTCMLFTKLRNQDIKRAKMLRPQENDDKKEDTNTTTATSGVTSGTASAMETMVLEDIVEEEEAAVPQIMVEGVPVEEGVEVKPDGEEGDQIHIAQVVVEVQIEPVPEEMEGGCGERASEAVIIEVGKEAVVFTAGKRKNETMIGGGGEGEPLIGGFRHRDHEDFVMIDAEDEGFDEERTDSRETPILGQDEEIEVLKEEEVPGPSVPVRERTVEEEIEILVEEVLVKVVKLDELERMGGMTEIGVTLAAAAEAAALAFAHPPKPVEPEKKPALKLLHTSTKLLFIIVSLHLLVEMPVAVLLTARFCAVIFGYDINDTIFSTEFTNAFLVARNFAIIITYPFNFSIYFGMSSNFKEELLNAWCMLPCLRRWRSRRASDSDDWGRRFSMPATKSSDESNLCRYRRLTLCTPATIVPNDDLNVEEGGQRRETILAGSHCVLYEEDRHFEQLL